MSKYIIMRGDRLVNGAYIFSQKYSVNIIYFIYTFYIEYLVQKNCNKHAELTVEQTTRIL